SSGGSPPVTSAASRARRRAMHFSALATRSDTRMLLCSELAAVAEAVSTATIEQRIFHPPNASSAGFPPATAPPASTVASAPQTMLMIDRRASQGRHLE